MSCHQNVGQNYNCYNDLKKVAKFKYIGMAVTNQNYVHEEIKSK